MRNKFDQQLEKLNQELIRMGALCETAIDAATTALGDKNVQLAKNAIALDSEIDQAERDIEALCLKLLLQQQPVARDLRQISSALKMITDLERIGDQAADISEIVLTMTLEPYVKKVEHILEMSQATRHMVSTSVDAYVKKDLDLAKSVIEYDDVVDGLFATIKQELIQLIAADPSCGEQALNFLMIAKYFERIGDHATNLAEWVEFSILGYHIKDRVEEPGQ